MQERVKRARDPGLGWVGLSQDPIGMSSQAETLWGFCASAGMGGVVLHAGDAGSGAP